MIPITKLSSLTLEDYIMVAGKNNHCYGKVVSLRYGVVFKYLYGNKSIYKNKELSIYEYLYNSSENSEIYTIDQMELNSNSLKVFKLEPSDKIMIKLLPLVI